VTLNEAIGPITFGGPMINHPSTNKIPSIRIVKSAACRNVGVRSSFMGIPRFQIKVKDRERSQSFFSIEFLQ
jgi:hypothetical protein